MAGVRIGPHSGETLGCGGSESPAGHLRGPVRAEDAAPAVQAFSPAALQPQQGGPQAPTHGGVGSSGDAPAEPGWTAHGSSSTGGPGPHGHGEQPGPAQPSLRRQRGHGVCVCLPSRLRGSSRLWPAPAGAAEPTPRVQPPPPAPSPAAALAPALGSRLSALGMEPPERL